MKKPTDLNKMFTSFARNAGASDSSLDYDTEQQHYVFHMTIDGALWHMHVLPQDVDEAEQDDKLIDFVYQKIETIVFWHLSYLNYIEESNHGYTQTH
jgi:hypothetical protein